jgi:hypothetical protein
MLRVVNSLVTQINAQFAYLFNYMNTNDPENTVSQIVSLSKNIVNNLQPPVTDSYNNYSKCYNANQVPNNNSSTGYSEACYQNWPPTASNFIPAPCSQALQTWISNFEILTTAYENLINLLLDYQPYDASVYAQNTISSGVVGCILPQLCIDNAGKYNCTYSIPMVTADFDEYVNNVTSSLNTINVLYDQYKPFIASSNIRISALYNQLKVLSIGIKDITDPNAGQIQAIFTQCRNDTVKYQQELEKQQIIGEVFSGVIGMILGTTLVAMTGGLGITILPQLMMALTMIPQINNDTIGLASSILGQDIASQIDPINN